MAGEAVDTLIGNADANHFVSLGGDTILTGGQGADQFELDGGGFGTPAVIVDFDKGTDVLTFNQGAAQAFDFESDLIPLGLLSPDRFALEAAADPDDIFIFSADNQSLAIDIDGTGPFEPVTLMTFANSAPIEAEDILITAGWFSLDLEAANHHDHLFF